MDLQHQQGTLDPSYLLTYFIHKKKIGDTFVQWPLHITIIPWFNAKDLEALESDLIAVARMSHAVDIVGSEIKQFGERNVCLVEPRFEFGKIHRAIYARLQKQNATFIDTRYFGEHYTPHVTEQSTEKFKVNQKASINGFYLLKRHREQNTGNYIKTVVREYVFNE